MTISIVTICYNNLPDLLDTCASVDKQIVLPLEHLIINGSSTGDIEDYLNKNQQPYYRKIINEKDEGIYDAMNKGILNVKGSYIMLLNSGDCLYDEYTLSIYNEKIKAIPANMYYAKALTKDNPLGFEHVLGKGRSIILKDYYYFSMPVCHQTCLIDKKCFDLIGLHNLRYTIAADTEWLIRYFSYKQFKSYYIDRITISFQTSGTSFNNRIKGFLQAFNATNPYIPFHVVFIRYLILPFLILKKYIINKAYETRIYKKYKLITEQQH